MIKNKIISILIGTLIAGAGFLAINTETTNAQATGTTAALSLDQMEQMIISLQKQIAQIVAILQTRANNKVSNPTAGWKTYTDDQHAFEVKYPADYKIIDKPTENDYTDPNPKVVLVWPMGLDIFVNHGEIIVQEIDSSKSNIKSSDDCVFTSAATQNKEYLSFVSTKDINGIRFYYYKNNPEYITDYCGMTAGCWYNDLYRTFYNGKCYELKYNRSDREFIEGNPYGTYGTDYKIIGDVVAIPDIFNQVIATFKFTSGSSCGNGVCETENARGIAKIQ